ncbi:acyl-CoA dehydrogenase family protein [Actinomadura geliboluensis]|uniref:Acyl-CoA dehydrogenase n=1 Tax=Actinomadura geliboluensis TaxID=882440 RepID=A0A5S4GZ46_9ACTN|nr:acyl-CoA dehydrogenase family protein [Actinomadura geliboluensis]TMR38177.1 acyl-CoA dehydrogenase [Actinomadura geliboluensis]
MVSVFVTDQHQQLREAIRAFALAKVAPRVAEMESSAAVDTALPDLIAQRGWIGVTIPRQYGGMGAGHLAKTILIEELSRVSGAAGAIAQASQLGVAKILHFGTEQQKQQWLAPIAAGKCLPTIATTEEDSGGHVLGMRATARRGGDHYILNGRKQYVGNSHVGHVHGVIARTGDADTRPSKSLSAFLVRADLPGVRLVPHQPAMGLCGFSFGDIVFEDVRVPVGDRLGEEGDGLDVAYSSSVLYGRPNLTAVSLGIHQAIVDATVEFVSTRRRYDAPLANLPSIKHKLGLMQHRLLTARVAAYHAVHLLDHGQPCDRELMSAKYGNVEAAMDSARTAMEIHAAAGLRTDHEAQRYYRDTACIYAPAGTGDIQLLRLAETALGISRGPQWSVRFAHLTALHPPSAPTETTRKPAA